MYTALQPYYHGLLSTVETRSNWSNKAVEAAKRINNFRQRYATIGLPNIPWYVVGIIHLMEAGLNFNCYLGNGQSLHKTTTMIPRGRGPFQTWEAGARDALILQGCDKITDWADEQVCYQLEGYNGWGYYMRHLPSPYLWSGTNHYVRGKFMETPGHKSYYAPNVVSGQIGAIPVYLELKKLNEQHT